jgi:tripartite-type tricarboxylate transporter receptor subunit TctC
MFAGGSVWTFQLLQKAPYDVLRDFSPVSLLVREVFVVAVHPSMPVKSVKELIALAKARPGELNYSSVGVGGSAHLATELFKSMAGGINVVHVPYKGNAGAITALISGEVQMLITDGGLLAPHIKAGKARAVAVTSAEPSALAPGLPTVSASGVPGYEAVSMTGVFVPAKTSAAIINRLNQEFVRFLSRPEVKEQFLGRGAEVVASSPEQFAAAVKSDLSNLGKAIKTAGIKAE